MAAGYEDKRKVATDALETLGTIIDDKQKRDAIHLAVEPVVAGERLDPGDHVTVKNGVASFCNSGDAEALGIVDPFLTRSVHQGERFWFVMYPRMVHSLRHVWTHPAFPDEAGTSAAPSPPSSSEPEDGTLDVTWRPRYTKAEAERWLRKFADTVDVPSFEEMMSAVANDRGHVSFGVDASGEIPEEFWPYAEAYLGHQLVSRPEWFSCSC